MNDEWNQPGFSASDEEKNSEMPDSFSEKAESTEQEQAPSWGKPSEQQPWQSAQSEQNAQPFAPQQMPRYDSAPRYGEGYQNYNAPRAGQPNHARKKKNRNVCNCSFIMSVAGAVFVYTWRNGSGVY